MTSMKHFILALGLTLAAAPVLADDITDAVQEGLDAYKANNLGKAASQWEYAAQLVRQNKAKKVTELLPKPLEGWKANDADSSSAGAAMFGGGINVSREYYVEDADGNQGDRSVTVELTMDSPLLQSMIGMLANPQFAAMSGGKITKINGVQAIQEGGGDENTKLSMVINNTVLVTVDGQPEQDVMAYAKAIDLKAIADLK